MRFRYPKSARLLQRRHFNWLKRNCKIYTGKWVVIEFFKPKNNFSTGLGLSSVKLGITVTKRYGKACERNRIKRLIREAYRFFRPQFPFGLQMVVKPKGSFLQCSKLKAMDLMSDFAQFLETLKTSCSN